ncbi:BnaA04g19430D [Brassica napus]|uniref:BnaA04g19430D protein n=2 Tax=Brassica napus TaxID=3708 RepID=A0A078HHA6_BRANA|nr:BnaA04g19430D [Brassica napus]
MGCFTGCFGLSSNTKRRNSTRKILPQHQRFCSYEPLLSSDPSDSITNVDSPEKISTSNLRCEVEKGTKKTRKRVRFNLNVQTFEPPPPSRYESYCSDDDDEEAKGEIESSRSVYPSNYRYHDCEDEDELGYGESDLEDEDYNTDDEDDADDEDEDEYQDVTPLLNPVENIAQWKEVKAKPVRVKQQLMKENVEVESDDDQARPLLKEIIVNTSLADWLVSPKTGSAKRSPIVDITNMANRSKVPQ